MPDRDFYEVLGIAKDASADQIKKAYRGLARKHHPDLNPENKAQAEVKFKEAQQAYDILSEPEKRKLYDQFGHAAFDGSSAGPRAGATEWAARGAGGPGGNFENFDFGQFFGQGGPGSGQGGNVHFEGDEHGGGGGMFDELIGRMRGGKQARKPRGPRPGQSVEANLSIPFVTAVRGGETTVDLAHEGGKTESLLVKIPPGLESGAKLRLKGRGEPGEHGAPAGDLVIQVEVLPHPYFQRDGRDLKVEVPISISEAVLGGKIDVPTLDGSKTMPIPPGSSTGQKLRLRGQGLPAAGSKLEGDLFVQLKVVVPKNIDDASKKLIEQFAERNKSNPREGLW